MKKTIDQSMQSDLKRKLEAANFQGDDKNLHDSEHIREYWYSIGDGFRLLLNMRKKILIYKKEDNIEDDIIYAIKAPGEEYVSTRENEHKILITDPYYIDNFESSLDDDIKTIMGTHTIDEHGVDQQAKNNLWSSMPKIIIIPLLSGIHWRSIRIEIDYTNQKASILYDDPYGAKGFSDSLINIIEPSLNTAISQLMSSNAGQVVTIESISIIIHKKSIDQQGRLENGYDCGPITFSNIANYANHEIINEQFINNAGLYTISLASDEAHENQMLQIRATNVVTYKEESGITMSESIIERIIHIKQLLKDSIERKKQHVGDTVDLSIITKINNLPDEVCGFIFDIIDNERSIGKRDLAANYTDEELKNAYNLIVDKETEPKRLSGSFYNDIIGLDSNAINKILKEKKGEFNKLVFAIGDDNFAEIIKEKREFIDKSLFIKDILESGDKVILITRPRRWGKTTNMEMLKSFLSVAVDNSNKSLFDKLLIGQEAVIVSEYQGKYPVIFISFKNIGSYNYQKIEVQLKNEIKKLYRKYDYLQYSTILSEYYKNDFYKYLKGDISEDGVETSLSFLSELLSKHHNQLVYILIDEYDTPLNNAYQGPDYNQIVALMRSVLGNALKGNEFIKKSVITGVTKIAKAGIFSGLNNVSEYSILQSEYAQYFGFTEEEVEKLINKADIKDITIKEAIKAWYNGYQIGDCIIYNPWSIANFFKNMQIRSYWVNTESMVLGNRIFSSYLLVTDLMQEQVRKMIVNCQQGMKQTIEITINPEVIFTDFKNDPVATWTLLAYSGYLSLESQYNNDHLTTTYQARIPNQEVMGIYMSSISLWINEKLNLDLKGLNDLLEDFNLEDINQLQKITREIISKYGSRVAQVNESIFHSLIEVICMLGGKKHILSSEKKSGTGRIDSIFYPVIKESDTVIIHEYKMLKKVSNEQEITEKIEEALWQVYEKNYLEEVITKHNSFQYFHYQNIEVRAIVILVDDNNRNFEIKVDCKVYSMEDSKKILAFFKHKTTKQLTDLKKNNIKTILSFITQSSDSDESLLKLQSEKTSNVGIVGYNDDIDILKLGKAIGNKKLARELVAKHGSELFEIDQIGLCKIRGIGKKKAETIEEYGIEYKKAKIEDLST